MLVKSLTIIPLLATMLLYSISVTDAVDTPTALTTAHKLPEIAIYMKPDPIFFPEDLKCLAKNIYFEARNQNIKGQIAVADVTLNRVNHLKFPNSICEVVWQKRTFPSGRTIAQFSWTLDGNTNTPKNKEVYTKIKILAAKILTGKIDPVVPEATHYHATYVKPIWRHNLTKLAKVGEHIFYSGT